MAKDDLNSFGFVETSIEKIKSLVDVSTIVGNPIVTSEGDTVIPIAKVSVGFFFFFLDPKNKKMVKETKFPLSGGIGTGYSINPIGFLVTQKSGSVRFLDIDTKDSYKFLFDSFLNLMKNINLGKE